MGLILFIVILLGFGNQSLWEKLNEIDTNVRMGFSSLHDFDRNRVATMRSVVREISFSEVSLNCSQGVATMFTAFYRGKLARVFTPHFNCSGYSPYSNDIIVHEKLDLAIIPFCPEAEQTRAINITKAPDIRLGDDVILYGHGEIAQVWKGVLSGYSKGKCGLATPWYGNGSICEGEFLVQSYQHNGLSGSPVSNGCGLIGMAHAFPSSSSGAIFAAVIGVKFIREMMSKFYHRLSNIEDCLHVSIENMPHYPFSNCDEVDDNECN